jgi:hypothetical protein
VWPDRDAYLRGRKSAPEAWSRLTDTALINTSSTSGILVEEKRVTWPE